jgi:hypothetical protein
MSEQTRETVGYVEHVQVQRVETDQRDTATPKAAGASKGLAQMFGLDIRAAMLTGIVDLMVFGGDVVSGGALLPVGIAVAGVLSFIIYKMQRHWYGDDHESSLIKALAVGLLTAIPVPLPSLLAIPAGILGLVHSVKSKRS